ncbi:MAG: tetratricopeptide repeat protein [Fusobacterium sp.]|nr:tetratricopeptide repeat protein [Fusobacterium sp.]MDO4690898.1 tetratricopeptide repeat protein [Fusobacterium sp.]
MDLDNLKRKREKYQIEGNNLKEVECLREILTFIAINYGKESDEYLKNLNELGGSLKYIGLYEEAESKLKEAMEIILKKYKEENIAYATTLLNLTEVYRFAGKYNLLEENYKKIFDIYIKNNMDKTFSFAGLCNNFGLYYQNINEFTKAYELHIKSLKILKDLDKEEYLLEYAVTLSNLFNPTLQMGMKEKAIDYLNKSLEMFEKNVGTNHPLYAASLNNMAIYYFNERNFQKAVQFFEKAAEISKLTMGEESDNYKNIVSNIKFLKEEVLNKEIK